VIGIRPAENPLNPQALTTALLLLAQRLEDTTQHQAKKRLSDFAWMAADTLLGLVNDHLADCGPDQAADLVEAQAALRNQLYRLRIMHVRDPETGLMRAAQLAA